MLLCMETYRMVLFTLLPLWVMTVLVLKRRLFFWLGLDVKSCPPKGMIFSQFLYTILAFTLFQIFDITSLDCLLLYPLSFTLLIRFFYPFWRVLGLLAIGQFGRNCLPLPSFMLLLLLMQFFLNFLLIVLYLLASWVVIKKFVIGHLPTLSVHYFCT